MQSGKPTQIIIAATGSVIAGLGLGPLVTRGAAEVVGATNVSVVTTNIVILICVATIFLLGRTVQAGKTGPSLAWLLHPHMRWLALGSIAVAGVAIFIANIDSANTSAWRGATRVSVDAGASSSRLREFGRQFARISVTGPSREAARIADVAVGWHIWSVGGRADLLVRKSNAGSGVEDPCEDRDVLSAVAIGATERFSDTMVQAKNVCGQWQLLQIELPRGVTALQFSL
ncbi:MAG: hypothetical protein ACR2QR_01325, partial [Woeseiaceae bacterium]